MPNHPPAKDGPQPPLLEDVPRRRQREVDGGEEEVGQRQGDDEHGGGVRPELRAAGQRNDGEEVAQNEQSEDGQRLLFSIGQ